MATNPKASSSKRKRLLLGIAVWVGVVVTAMIVDAITGDQTDSFMNSFTFYALGVGFVGFLVMLFRSESGDES